MPPANGGGPDVAKGPGGFGGPPGSGPSEGGRPRGSGSAGKGRMDMMQFDKNKDGKVARDELPEQMQAFFDRMDANSDGFIDKAEMAAMRARFQKGGKDGPGSNGPPP